jgi:AraC-like DNA-binding protein
LIDARILHATRYIKQNLDSELDVKTVASEACLSESRFSHLFKEQIGIPLRRYILWCRMENAIRLIANGTNLSQAAYECGFSDPAHLTRTFQEMFGVKPSQALKQ